jgi:hypothetical protein
MRSDKINPHLQTQKDIEKILSDYEDGIITKSELVSSIFLSIIYHIQTYPQIQTKKNNSMGGCV